MEISQNLEVLDILDLHRTIQIMKDNTVNRNLMRSLYDILIVNIKE
jgi:hypothetical protein